jgi:tetratricopeptide (TPR) repeat protein
MMLSAFALLAAQIVIPFGGHQAADDQLKECLQQAQSDPTAAVARATAWLAKARDAARAEPHECIGQAYAGLQRWSAARDAFLAARDARAANDHLGRARLGAMAGNAALAGSDAATALADLDKAIADATLAGDNPLAGSIEADKARALVALGRNDEAAKALARARTEAPQDPQVWLRSATLSRRPGDLTAARGQIVTAASLDRTDPAIGLEAGVIQALAGDEAAARQSWQSVVALAPDSPEAASAKGYLAQIGDEHE